MDKIFMILVGLALAGNGRRVQQMSGSALAGVGHAQARRLEPLAALLLGYNPAGAWQVPAAGFAADGGVKKLAASHAALQKRPLTRPATGSALEERVAEPMISLPKLRVNLARIYPSATRVPDNAISMQSAGLCTKLEVPSELLDKTDVFIFDCDGVIWKGDSLIEGIPAVLKQLKEAGKKIFFVTNNSTKSRKGYLGKFNSLGLTDVEPEEIFSSSFAAAAYLEQTKFKDTGKKVYIIGEVGIEEELDLVGVPWIGGGSDADKKIELKSGYALNHDKDVGAVIVGFDREINYHKIQYAQLCINENEGCKFIATNLDRVAHLTSAQLYAGGGSMVGAIKGCTGKEPILVGKPSPLIIDYIVEKYGCKRERICMVGDRLDTDILFGQNNGLLSCLTLSGVTTQAKLMSDENKIKPDYYVDSIADFYP